jgi:hypothetical protein
MVATEAQKRASKKWNENNKERFREMQINWLEKNRDRVNEMTAKRQLSYYYVKKASSYEWAVKELFKIKI